jgi:hypothetical protein
MLISPLDYKEFYCELLLRFQSINQRLNQLDTGKDEILKEKANEEKSIVGISHEERRNGLVGNIMKNIKQRL